jgi:ATP-dependent protease ClpP protease subunit
MGIVTSGQQARWDRLSADPVRRARLAAEAAQERDRRAQARLVREIRTRRADFADSLDLWPAVRDALAPAAGPVLHLYGEVGWEIRADDLAASLAQLGGQDVTVYLSSPGGEAAGGIDCYSVLARHGGQVTVVVDALAASAASVIAMGASPGRLLVGPSSLLMVHEAWMFTGGPASELRAAADVCDKMSSNIASIYAARSGLPAAYWLAAMENETWMTSQEAVDEGLADAVVAGAAVSPAGDGDEELGDSEIAVIANVLRGQLMAMADPGGPQRGFHPDGRPVTREERRAAFEAYARAQAQRKAPGNGRAFNAAHPDADVSPWVKRMFGLDD